MAQLIAVTVVCLVLQYGSCVSSDTIVFPGDDNRSSKDDSKKEIPLEMVLRLNTITEESQLFRDFISQDDRIVGIEPDFIQERFGGVQNEANGVERKALAIPKPAGCIPELRSVSLQEGKEDWEYYFPSCTRIEQCGGCCSHKLLSCQPIDVEPVNYQVIVSQYRNGKLSFKGKEIVTVEKHNKCKCDCIVKEKDCNQLQEYRKGECRCVCTNRDAEQKCSQDNDTKLWNPDSCLCECRKTSECSTGSYFSQESCSCEIIPDTYLDSRFGIGTILEGGYQTSNSERNRNSNRKWPPRYIVD